MPTKTSNAYQQTRAYDDRYVSQDVQVRQTVFSQSRPIVEHLQKMRKRCTWLSDTDSTGG